MYIKREMNCEQRRKNEFGGTIQYKTSTRESGKRISNRITERIQREDPVRESGRESARESSKQIDEANPACESSE